MIRPAAPSDAPTIEALITESVNGPQAGDYDAGQWAGAGNGLRRIPADDRRRHLPL